jgi:adenylate cyclase
MKIKLILLLLISISINSEPINLTKIDTYFDIKEAKVYIDDSNQKTIDQIISEVDESEFKSYNNLNFGLSKSTFWVKLNLLSESNLKDHYIEINHPVLDYIELFYPNTEGYYQSIISGDQLPFYDREYIYRTFIFNLPIYMIQKEHSFYLKVKSSSTISIPIKIWQEKALIEKNSFEQFILGIYYGLIFVMAIYNLFLFIFVKDFSYLYYVGYIISFGLLQMSLNGLAFQYLWPNSTWLASYAPTFLIPQFAVFVIQFSRYFINSKEMTPKLDILL